MSLILKYSIAAVLLLVAVFAVVPLLTPSTASAAGEECTSDSDCASDEQCDLDQEVCVVPGPDNPGPGCEPQPEGRYCRGLRLLCENSSFPASILPCGLHWAFCRDCR